MLIALTPAETMNSQSVVRLMRIVTLAFLFIPIRLLSAVAPPADDPPRPPIASNPVVDVRGTVAKVQLAPGQGMPFLEISTPQGPVKLYLGSMRYLMQEDFNPKAGEAIEARAYRMGDQSLVGIRVELPASRKTLKLRDENGWPMWMGGRQPGRGMGPQPGRQPPPDSR
jgi:hypothetical protein